MGVILGACFDDEYMPDLEHLIHHNSRDIKIYGRGDNRDGHLSKEDYFYAQSEWKRMTEIEQVLIKKAKFKHLYISYESISIINNLGEIYVAGNNKYNKLGIIQSKEAEEEEKKKNESQHRQGAIRGLTRVPFDAEANGNPILLSQGIRSEEMSFIYTDSNKLFANGRNWVGGFGNGKTNNEGVIHEPIPQFWSKDEQIAEIHCGSSFTLFLTDIHNLYGTGYCSGVNSDSHLKTPKLLHENIVKLCVGIYYGLLINKENKLIINGKHRSKDELTCPETKSGIENFFNDNDNLDIKSIHGGFRHGMIICENLTTKKNELYTFGNNFHGQIGNGQRNTSSIAGGQMVTKPFLVVLGDGSEYAIQGSSSENHNVILSNKNNLWAFGSNWSKKCGNDEFAVWEVTKPYLVDKEEGIKINKTAKIEMVIATHQATLIVVQ